MIQTPNHHMMQNLGVRYEIIDKAAFCLRFSRKEELLSKNSKVLKNVLVLNC